MAKIVSTCFEVEGVANDDDTKKALQALFDVFAENGMGQATFEIVPGQHTQLWVKHTDDVQPSSDVIDEALAKAGDFRLVNQ